MVQRKNSLGVNAENKYVALEPCTVQHLSVTEDIKNSYDKVNAKNWLCPPLNYTFDLQGKYTS